MAGNEVKSSSVSATGMDVRQMPVYRLHINARMPTPFALNQFPLGAKLRQDEDGEKQQKRKEGRVENLAQDMPAGMQMVVKRQEKKPEEVRKLATAQIVSPTDMVTMMNLSFDLRDNYLLIGYDFTVTDGGRSTKIKLRLVKQGMKFEKPKPAEDAEGQRRQAYFHDHQRELWEEFIRWAKKMVVSLQVAKNEARVMPDNAIIQVDATHAKPLANNWLPTQRLVINDHNAFLAKV